MRELHFTKCSISGCNLFFYEKIDEDHYVAKCKICGKSVQLQDNKQGL